MSDGTESGGYFSRNYARVSGLAGDSPKLRLRIATYLMEYCGNETVPFGKYIEQELGIRVLRSAGYGLFVDWDRVLEKCTITDFLDILTAVVKFQPRKTIRKERMSVVYDFRQFVQRALREECAAYRMDESGHIHPFVDAAFTAEITELIRGFSSDEFTAAKAHITEAELALLEHKFEGRKAVRSVFDAIENIFKLIFPKCNQLNNRNVTNCLLPLLEKTTVDSHEKLAVAKLCTSFVSWVEAGHFYRHEPGKPDPTSPSEVFAIQYVSQGIGYARWLGGLLSDRRC